jgi:ATP-dependent RNA helicase DHX37/DHR1
MCLQSQGYGESNQFVLPSAKRKFIKEKEVQVSRILSKRQRKNLEKIIDKKKKKSERGQLIEKLQSVQVPDTELALLTSLSTIQVTFGFLSL